MRLIALKRSMVLATALWTLAAPATLLREEYASTRALGMGNAFLAVADDAWALWYNPAGLAWVRGNHFHLVDARLNVDGMDTLGRIGRAVLDGDTDNLVRTDTQYMGAGVRPTFVTKYFGISFYDTATSFTDFRDLNTLDATVDIDLHNDAGVILATGFPFTPFVSVGASIRVFQRSGINATLDTQTLIDQIGVDTEDFQSAIYDYLKDQLGMGWAVGVNLGGMVRIPIFGKNGPEWTVAGQIENVGTTKFRRIGGRTNLPADLETAYHAGTAFKYTLSKSAQLNLAVDYRHMVQRGVEGVKKFHAGVELRTKFLDLRLGMYQLYPTFGFGLKLPSHTRINFASYAEELGSNALERGRRLYEIQLVLGFNPL